MNNLETPSLAAPLTVEEINLIKLNIKNRNRIFFISVASLAALFVLLLIYARTSNVELLSSNENLISIKMELILMPFISTILALSTSYLFYDYTSKKKYNNGSCLIDIESVLSSYCLDNIMCWKEEIEGVSEYITSVNKMGRRLNEDDFLKIKTYVDVCSIDNHQIYKSNSGVNN